VQVPHSPPRRAPSRAVTPALWIEHSATVDMADGQPLPPLIEDGVVWHLVRRANGCTTWRRIFLENPARPDCRQVAQELTRRPTRHQR
jgi:hypothetical protein